MRIPTHPGVILKELYLDEIGISISDFSTHIGVSRKAVSAIVNGRKSVTPEMAIRLSMAFPNSTAASWVNLQRNYDLWEAKRELKTRHIHVKPIVAIA